MGNEIEVLKQLVFRDGDGGTWTTSLIVAEKFGKRHNDVLRAIRELDCSPEFMLRNFAQHNYIDGRGNQQPMFRMTRDGFMLLVMGFTGKPATATKEAFIAAFNEMEKQLTHGLAVWAKLDQVLSKHIEMSGNALTVAARVAERIPVVEEKVGQIGERVERIEDAFERLRPTLQRKDFSQATKQLYRLVVVRFYRGLCPCCQNVEVVSGSGIVLRAANYDHWTERNRNWPTDGWIVCLKCNQMLERERHKHTAQFSLFQQRLEQISGACEQHHLPGV